jgi:hypothetical protein
MKCWNCGYEVQAGTKVCRRCETDQTDHPEPDPEALGAAQKALEQIAPESLESLKDIAMRCDTAEAFVGAIMVGPCALRAVSRALFRVRRGVVHRVRARAGERRTELPDDDSTP